MENQTITVGELTRLIKNSLENNLLLQSVWIEGEVSNFRAPYSGHWYFSLKDSDALLRCVMFKSRIKSAQGVPKDGDKILIKGRISVYEKDGQYQCYVDRWLPSGIGELAEKFEKLKNQFVEEGLFAAEKKKQLPPFPKRIGLITSATGAAIQDMIRVGTRRNPGIHLSLFPVRVQGEEAADEIARAILLMDSLNFDAIVVGRGGGSLEDLWAFNEEIVVRAIFATQTPIVSAVGHESDFTLADFVADVRAATPSQAMEILVPERAAMIAYIEKEQQRLIRGIEQKIQMLSLRLKPTKKDLFRNIANFLDMERQNIEKILEKIENKSTLFLQTQKDSWGKLHLKLVAFDPYKNLARGYSLVTNRSNEVISSSKDVQIGENLKISLHKGNLDVIVKDKE